MDCIVFPYLRVEGGQVIEIKYPNAIFYGYLTPAGDGVGLLEFTDNLLFRGTFSKFNPDSELAVLEQENAVLCATHNYESYVLKFDQQQYYKNGDFLIALTDSARFAGQFKMNQANGFGLLIAGPADQIESAYLGDFQQNCFYGRGIYIKVAGANLSRFNRFEGYFVNGERNGSGCLCLGGGGYLIGQFLAGQKIGLFLFIGACGEIEFRYYQKDISKRVYRSYSYYITNASELKYLYLQEVDFEVAVQYFKFLEASGIPCQSVRGPRIENVPYIDTIWRYCKKATVPRIVGLVDDYRVCNFVMSEGIGELAREASGIDYCSAATQDTSENQQVKNLYKQMEQIKACIIGNYEILRFLFSFYRARDLLMQGERVKAEYKNDLLQSIGDALGRMKLYHAEQRRQKRKECTAKHFEEQRAATSAGNSAPQQAGQQGAGNQAELQNQLYNNSMQANNDAADQSDDETYKQAQVVEYDRSPIGEDDDISELSDAPYAEYYKLLNYLAETLAVMPQGHNARDNEMLEIFFGMLDANAVVSTYSVKQFVFDLAAHFESYAQVFPQEQVVDALIQSFARYSDSYQTILYYDIYSLLNSSSYVLDFNAFVLVTLSMYSQFAFQNPSQFVQDIVFVYAKATLTQLITALDYDSLALTTLFDAEDPFFKQMKLAKSRQITPNRRCKLDNDAVSIAPSQASKMMSSISKNGRDRAKANAVPRILLRDNSSMLTDIEQAIFRCRDLPEKLNQLIQLNIKYEQMFIFRPFINAKLEQLINQEFGITIMQYLDIVDINLLDFVFVFFDRYNDIFSFPRISEQTAFYFYLFAPFFIRFQQEKCELFATEAVVDKCYYLITHLSCFWMNYPILTAVIACCLLKVYFPAEKQENDREPEARQREDEADDPISDQLSCNSFTSMAETALSAQSSQSQSISFRQLQQLKTSMFDRKWEGFQEELAIEMVGYVLKGIIEIWRKQAK